MSTTQEVIKWVLRLPYKNPADYPLEDKKELETTLAKLGLGNLDARRVFYWTIERMLEQTFFQDQFLEGPGVAELVAKQWNERGGPIEVSTSHVIDVITAKGFNYTNLKRAFFSLCEGDVENYRIYDREGKLFADFAVRLGVLLAERKGNGLDAAREVTQHFFPSHGKKHVHTAISSRFGSPRLYGVMILYCKEMQREQLVFVQGMRAIWEDYSEKTNCPITKAVLAQEGRKPKAREEKPQVKKEEKREVVSLEEVSTTAKLLLQQLGSLEESSLRIASLEAQNRELQGKIDTLENLLREGQREDLGAFLRNMAKAKDAFPLAELLAEMEELSSAREITEGRLVNFFSNLELLGVCPLFHARRLGEIFRISRGVLVQNFLTQGYLPPSEDELTVQLVHCGWSFGGQVLVMPVVKVLSEEEGEVLHHA